MASHNYDTSKPFKRLLGLLFLFKKEIYYIYVYAFFNGLISLSLPLGTQAIITIIQTQQITTSWAVLIGIICIGLLVSGLLQVFQLSIIEVMQQKVFAKASFELSYRIPRFRIDVLNKYYPPELINRFFDVLTVQKGIPKVVMELATALLSIIFGLVLLSFYHSSFVFFGILLVFLVFMLFYLTFKKGILTSLKESTYKYEVAGWLEEIARAMTTFKLTGKDDLTLEKTDNIVGHYVKARQSHFKVIINLLYSDVAFKVFITALFLVTGSYLVVAQEITIGQFVASEIIIISISNSIDKVINSMPTIYDTLTAIEKLGYVTDIELEKEQGLDFDKICDNKPVDIELLNLSFGFEGAEKKILKDISLHIKGGERICVIGPNHSGKSTLLKVISGFYDSYQGQILYNNIPLSNIEFNSLRTKIGNNSINQHIINSSMLDNLTLGEPVEVSKIIDVIKQVGLDKFINTLPNGFHTEITAEGRSLPQSVRKKIILARSFIKEPKIMLIDDYELNFDAIENNRLIECITHHQNKWTLIANSSDKHLASKCDKIIYLNDGVIEKIFTYDELVADDYYSKFLKSYA